MIIMQLQNDNKKPQNNNKQNHKKIIKYNKMIINYSVVNLPLQQEIIAILDVITY